jgi:hypothetical protein
LWTPTPLVKKHFFGIIERCYNTNKTDRQQFRSKIG